VRPLSQIWAYCEGRTEKQYIEDLANYVGRRLIHVEVTGQVGVPLSVVSAAKQKLKELKARSTKRGASSFDTQFTVWAVFDRDAHDSYDVALETARTSEVAAVYSNPCVEIWAIYHLENDDRDPPLERRGAQSRLRELMPSYSHEGNPYFDFLAMHLHYQSALIRAGRCVARCVADGRIGGCPSTNMYLLTEHIAGTSGRPDEREQRAVELQRRIAEIESLPEFVLGDPQLHSTRSELFNRLRAIKK